jgi:hypothetical protein
MALADPTGLLLTGIRDDAGVAALTDRVRCPEPLSGDALGPGKYQAFIVLSQLGRSRLKRAPLQEVRYVAKCYAATFQAADALAGAVSAAVHAVGRRASGGGVVIFGSFDDGSQGATKDPNTGQPMSALIISVGALTETIP